MTDVIAPLTYAPPVYDPRRARFSLFVDDVESGRDLAPYLNGATYTDRAHGLSDDLEIDLDDADGRFTSDGPDSWAFPDGTRLVAAIESGGESLPLGSFLVDEVRETSSASSRAVVFVRAQSAAPGAAGAFRTKERTCAYGPAAQPEGIAAATARDVFAAVASRNGLALVFTPTLDVAVERVDQVAKTDAAFATAYAAALGYRVAVRASTTAESGSAALALVVTDDAGPAAASDVLTLTPYDVESKDITRQGHGRATAARCAYYDAAKGEAIDVTVKAGGRVVVEGQNDSDDDGGPPPVSEDPEIPSLPPGSSQAQRAERARQVEARADRRRAQAARARATRDARRRARAAEVVLQVPAVAATLAEATALCSAALASRNRAGSSGTLGLKQGRVDVAAGSYVRLLGFGLSSGLYLVTESRHSVTPANGHTTALNVVRVPSAADLPATSGPTGAGTATATASTPPSTP